MNPSLRHAHCFASIAALTVVLSAGSVAHAAVQFGGGGIVSEGDAGTRTVSHTVSANSVLPFPLTIAYETIDLTATGGEDYDIATGTVTLNPGLPEHVRTWAPYRDPGGISSGPMYVYDIAVSGGGDINVLGQTSVSKYNSNGSYIGQYGTPSAILPTWFNPEFITIAKTNRALIGSRDQNSDPFELDVWWSETGVRSVVIDIRPPGTEEVTDAATAPDGTVFVCGNGWIEQWKASGTNDSWSKIRSYRAPAGDYRFRGLAVASDFTVHAITAESITNLSLTSNSLRIEGRYPTPYEFPVSLQDIAIDSDDIVYLAADGEVIRFYRYGIYFGTFAQGSNAQFIEISPSDEIYVASSGPIGGGGTVRKYMPTLPPSLNVDVTVRGDQSPEPNESFVTRFHYDEGNGPSFQSFLTTIQDDDPGAFVSGATIAEGNAGTRLMNFQIGVTTPITSPVTIDYSTVDGTASAADGDYSPDSGTLTFLPNGSVAPTPQDVRIDIHGDMVQEGNESLTLELTNVTGAAIQTSTGVGVIMDDETTFAFEDAAAPEGNSGTTQLMVPVTSVTPFYSPVEIHYHTVDGTALSATGDFAPITSSVVLETLQPTWLGEIDMYNCDNGCQNFDPAGIALTPDGNLVWPEAGGTGGAIFTREGTHVRRFGFTDDPVGMFIGGWGVDTDSQGNMFVAHKALSKFTPDGTFVTRWGNAPDLTSEELQWARDVAVDPADFVFVIDSNQFEVEQYTNSGNFLRKFGSRGSGPGQFEFPVGITVDANQAVYVSDRVLHRITKFSTDGTLLGTWGSQGSGPGQFNRPEGMGVDAKGRLHVCDENNGRIQVFSPDGDYITEWRPTALGGIIDDPVDITFDLEGVAWVIDRSFGTDGRTVVESYALDVIVPEIPVTINGDFIEEGDETFSLTVTGTVGDVTVVDDEALLTILNDDEPLGSVVYVDRSATEGGDGSSWAAAFNDLALALDFVDQSPGAAEVWVADGLYHPTSGNDREATFGLSGGIAVYGGFAGGEVNRGDRDPTANLAILSGDIGVPEDTSDNVYRVVSCVTTDSIPLTATLDGFIVTGANSIGQPETLRGGGIAVHYGTFIGRNLRLVDNQAQFGGGIANQFGIMDLENIEIRGNFAEYGGGIDLRYSSSAMANVVVEGNSAAYIGGVRLVVATLDMAHSTIAYNSASVTRGGIQLFVDCVLTARNSIIWGNAAPTDPNLYILNSTLDIGHSILEGSGGSSAWNGAFGSDSGGNLDTDPMFMNSLIGALQLQAGSPAIDAGDDTIPNMPATDLAGTPRPSGLTADMGAYEFAVVPTGVEENVPSGLPTHTALHAPYPNPFNPRATMSFSLKASGRTSIDIFDVRGRLITNLLDEDMPAGSHQVVWSGRDQQGAGVASGVYLVRFRSAGVQQVKRVTLIK